jgi:hypothetical protein
MNCLAPRPMALVVLLAMASGWAEQPRANPADEKALGELHRAFLAAFNKGDAEGGRQLWRHSIGHGGINPLPSRTVSCRAPPSSSRG